MAGSLIISTYFGRAEFNYYKTRHRNLFVFTELTVTF
jgi:hypothetical protein